MKRRLKEVFTGDSPNELRFKFTGTVRYIPLIVCGGFFLLTILIFAFGPMDWEVSNPFKLYSFLALSCIALVLGYVLAVKKGRAGGSPLNLSTNAVLITCVIVFFITYIPMCVATTGKWYPDIVTGITDTGKAYYISKYLSVYGPKIVFYIRMLVYPFIMLIMPVTLFFMPKLTKTGKTLGILAIVLSVCLSVSQGVNKACADITAQIVLFLLMLMFSNSYKGSKAKHVLKICGIIIVVCSLFFAYYSAAMRNRVAFDTSGYSDKDIEQIFKDPSKDKRKYIDDMEVDKMLNKSSTFNIAKEKSDYFLFKIVPDRLKPSLLYLTSYVSHGYKGLSIAMDKEFTSTYGLGFSDFFRHNALKLFGQSDIEGEIYSRTYMAKTAEEGWVTGAVWSSFFVYPASDISFPATILLVFVIGYLFALSWKDALKTGNPFAVVVFFAFCTMIFYFSANNQIFQGGETFIGFTTMIIIWLISRAALLRREKKQRV